MEIVPQKLREVKKLGDLYECHDAFLSAIKHMPPEMQKRLTNMLQRGEKVIEWSFEDITPRKVQLTYNFESED